MLNDTCSGLTVLYIFDTIHTRIHLRNLFPSCCLVIHHPYSRSSLSASNFGSGAVPGNFQQKPSMLFIPIPIPIARLRALSLLFSLIFGTLVSESVILEAHNTRFRKTAGPGEEINLAKRRAFDPLPTTLFLLLCIGHVEPVRLYNAPAAEDQS